MLLSPSALVTDAQYDALCDLLQPAGRLEGVSEAILTKAMSVFSCSPAFAYLFIEAMADGAVQLGLPRDMAQRYAAQAVRGAATMVLETGMHPGALKDAVCSPGGYTIQGVNELEKRGFRAAGRPSGSGGRAAPNRTKTPGRIFQNPARCYYRFLMLPQISQRHAAASIVY